MLNLDLWLAIASIFSGLGIGARFFRIFSRLQSNLSFFKTASTVCSVKLEKNIRSFASCIGLTAQVFAILEKKHWHDLHHLWSNGLVVKALDSQSSSPMFQTTGWLPRLIKWVPGISGNLLVKSKLPARSGSSPEAVEPHP